LALAARTADRVGTAFRAHGDQLNVVNVAPQALVVDPVLWKPKPGSTWRGEEVELRSGSDARTTLAAIVGSDGTGRRQAARRRESAKVPRGWLSWYHYGPWVSREDVISNSEVVASAEWAQLGYRLIQIDDGWQHAYGDWRPNTKFGSGMKQLSDELAKRGQTTGVWTAPFLVSASSDLAESAPDDWFLRHPVTGSREVDHRHQVFGPMYVLDARKAAVRRHLEETFAGLRTAGIRYFKLDFLYAGAYAGLAALRARM
jgi:alpha-galactosidase